MSCGVGHKCGSDLALLWLWHRPAAIAPIRPLACKPPYALGVALKGQKPKKKKKKKDDLSPVDFFFSDVQQDDPVTCIHFFSHIIMLHHK